MLPKRTSPFSSGLILRPSVAVTQAWVFAAASWSFFFLFAAEAPPPGGPFRLIDGRAFALASGANAALFVILLLELRWVLRAPTGLRRVQIAGHAGALMLLVALQELAWLAHGGTP